MMELAKQDISSSEFASEELLGDKDIITEAVKKDGNALDFVSEELMF